jgi:hypothetical protein
MIRVQAAREVARELAKAKCECLELIERNCDVSIKSTVRKPIYYSDGIFNTDVTITFDKQGTRILLFPVHALRERSS